ARRLRLEQEKRDARIRSTLPYQELMRFVDVTRKGRPGREGDSQLLALLLQELNVTDPGEQRKVRAELTDQPAAVKALEKTVAAKRALFKAEFRAIRDCDAADGMAFDGIVDRVLDGLLVEMRE